ncbi:MAG: hypothetical protein AB7O52_18195 [Planctomycetota bacterium]
MARGAWLGIVATLSVATALALYGGLRAGVASLFFREAQRSIEEGDSERGLRILEDVERWDASHRETQRLLALQSLAHGDAVDGVRRLELLYSAGDRSVDLLDIRARLAEESGDIETARLRFIELCREHPTHVAGPLGLARLAETTPGALSAFLEPNPAATATASIRGISFFHVEDDLGLHGYGTASAATSLVAARRSGARALALRIPARQSSVRDPEVRFGVEAAGGETDLAIVRAIRDAKRLGFVVMLKPHIMLEHITADEWRGTLGFEDPVERQRWWAGYRAFLMHCAAIAARERVDILCIGVELRRMVLECPTQWQQLIQELRGVYPGQLTYAANWYHEYREVPFWSQLDLLGVQFFFPISTVEDPTLAELQAGLAAPVDELEDLAEFYDRPVVLTEVGYKSTPGATREPWIWPRAGSAEDPDLQARAYQAVLEAFANEPWFAGMFWWNWLTLPEPGPKFAHDFTPQEKPAAEVLRRAWGGGS